jgi:cytochrome c
VSIGLPDGNRGEKRRPTMKGLYLAAIAAMGVLVSVPAAAQTGDAARGERLFRACAPCHSLEPNRSMTGPSLAELWNRKAGGLTRFSRYSPALKSSGIVWDDNTLEAGSRIRSTSFPATA